MQVLGDDGGLWGGGGEVCVLRQMTWLGPRVEVLGGDGVYGG